MPRSGLGGPSGWVYRGSWQKALAVGVMLSWGVTHIIAAALEHRSMLDLSGQYKAFYFGDLICLPGTVVAIWYLGRRMPRLNLSQKTWWHVLCFAFGVAYGIWWHLVDAASHFYARSMMTSPTKLYHDFVVFPLYIYILASAGLPALAKSKGGWKARAAVVVFLTVFALLNYYDAVHRPHHGHVNFDWSHLRPGK